MSHPLASILASRRLRPVALTAALLIAGITQAKAENSGTENYSQSYGSASVSVSAKVLNRVFIDSTSDNIYSVRTSGKRNYARIRMRGRGTVGLRLTQEGQKNDASLEMSGNTVIASVTQTSEASVHQDADGLQQGYVNGDYVTTYKSGGFGFISITSKAPTLGYMGRGH